MIDECFRRHKYYELVKQAGSARELRQLQIDSMLTETTSITQAGQFSRMKEIDSAAPVTSFADAGKVNLPVGKVQRRKILIVQGDWESGMARLALDLIDAGHEVAKVMFCASDLGYKLRGIPTHVFHETLDTFDGWLRNLVAEKGYDTFFLYNHYRPYNQVAWNLAGELGLGCKVFELGLIRPNCVMVFDRDEMPMDALAREWDKLIAGGPPPPQPVMPPELCQVSTPAKTAMFCVSYLFSRFTSPLFPNFVDQRDMSLWHHFKHGMIHAWRFFERAKDVEFDEKFANEWSGKYYAVPLQVHSDTQITRGSDFGSIEQFIREVVRSFRQHAPEHTKLVFKVHPMDRGYKDYADLITGLDMKLGGGRLFYVDRVHLPTMLGNSLGVVNVNSSVGISGLCQHVPVIALGRAVYDLPELTFQGPLAKFWTTAQQPKPTRVNQFIHLLLALNQGRGTLSQRCFDVPGRCRIKWPEPFQQEFFGDSPLLGFAEEKKETRIKRAIKKAIRRKHAVKSKAVA